MGEVNVTENDILLKKVRLLNACKTEAQWRQLDPVLLSGEVAFTIAKKDENDILNSAVLGYKVGNGTSKWSELDYPSGDWNINAKSAETAKEAETAKTAANATVADTALKWTYDTKVYVSLGTKSTDTRINARSSEDDDKAFSIGVDGVLGIENGGTGQSSFTKNTVLIINNDGKMQGTGFLDVSKGGTGKQSFTENYLIVGNGNSALKEIEILGVGHGGTGKKTLKEGFVLIGNGSSEINEVATYSEDVPKGELTGDQAKYIVTLGALKKYSGTSSISTVGTITNGTWKGSSIGANYGGTGLTKDEIGKANAVVITGGGDTNKLKIAESKAGAFYSTGNNSLPQFGTLKVAYGGTGSTTFTQNVPIFYNGTALESRNYFKSTIWSDGAEKVSGKNVYYITDGYGVAYFKRIGLGITPDSNYVLKTSGAIYISGNTTHSGDITFSALGSIGESNKITWGGGTDAADIYYKLEANDQGALIFNMRDDYNTHFRWAYNKSDLISMDMYSNFYPNTDLSGSLGTSMNRWGSIYAGILKLQGPSSNPSASAGARIEFTYDENTSKLQPVYISYTPNDSYRQPAGLKIFGGTNATPAWLEVEGDIYANKSIRNLEVGGGIYWNPYVESAADASDAASITVLNGGCAGGTELRISQQNDWNDVINLVTNSYIYLNGRRAFQINDSWLRINQDIGFSSGIYTGSSLVRSDYQFQVGDNGANFYANSSGNGYFSNTLGIGGTNTGYRLYVNGTAYITSVLTNSYHNFVVAGNEFNFIPESHGDSIWFNYVSGVSRNKTTTALTDYYFGNGQSATTTTLHASAFTGNAASATYTAQLLGVNDSNTPYGAIEGNLIRAVWNVKGDSRWYLKAGTYNCRVNYADNADMLDGYHESAFLRYSGWWNSDSGQNVNDASGMVFAYSNHGLPGSWGVVTTFDYSKNSDYRHQIYGDGWNNEMYFRTRSSNRGGWNAWRHLLDDVNYAGILDERYINASGDTMTGHLNATAGLTWNHAYWNPNGNIYCQPTDNYQEWSIDVGSTSYTGSLFHIWSARNSVSMLRCFSDNNSVDIPSGAFTVSGGNAYFTKTIICSSQIGNYGEGIRLNCDDGQWATITMGSTGDTGTRDNCWSIHRKSDNNFCISRNSSDGINGLVMTATGMGLGTTTPGYRLHVNGTSYFQGNVLIKNSSGGNYGGKLNFGDGDYVHLYEIVDDRLEIKASTTWITGKLSIGNGAGFTDVPSYNLYVNGTSYLSGDLTIPNNHAYYGILGSNSSTTSSNTGGLTWFNLDGTAGAQVNVNDTPTSAWWYILRNRHTNTGNNYYTDIAIPFNDTSIYYKTIRNGSVVNNSWVKVLDSNNYSSYVFLPWALFEIRQAQSSGSSIYIWWGTNNDFSPKDGNTPSGSSNFSLNTGNRSFINCPRSGYVRITVNLAVKASTEVSSCYLDINEYYNGSEHWKDRRIGLGNIKTNYTIVNGSTIVYVRKGACLQFKLGSITTLYEDYQTPYWPHIILEYIT